MTALYFFNPECEDHHSPSSKVLDCEDDSENGSRQEDLQAWSEMSIMERLGHKSVDMTEEELEDAFSHLALAFHCDQYTLDQRLQAEEHARNYAEESLKLEVERGQDLLETLKGMCLDIKRAKVIQSLELCLSIIGGTIERIANTAEVLGAVHQQEAKVSRAVELMVAHVENLRCRHERDSAELEEIKKQMQKGSRGRQASEIWEEIETFQKPEKETHQPSLRRRISAAIISKQDQNTQRDAEVNPVPSEEAPDTNKSARINTTDHGGCTETKPGQGNDHQPPDRSSLECAAEAGSSAACNCRPVVLDPCTHPSPHQCSTAEHHKETDMPSMNKPHSTLPRHRLKSKAALETSSSGAKGSQHSLSVSNTLPTGLQRSLIQWMLHCHWIIITIYLIVLCSIIILAILVWFLQAPVLWL
ncbi:protein MRVI1-like [Astyanax mexicanus]|uniref:Protein MRVI1-like n=1 Tax=Astyanax mexicanus TaxID=7994 RepID=A0A8T2LLV3_ASTMX|nr:protein MRVI1-like [Astyanax mexicanus]